MESYITRGGTVRYCSWSSSGLPLCVLLCSPSFRPIVVVLFMLLRRHVRHLGHDTASCGGVVWGCCAVHHSPPPSPIGVQWSPLESTKVLWV